MNSRGQRHAAKADGPAEELIHIECPGDIKPIQGLGLYCMQCDRLVGINEVREKPRKRKTLMA